MVIPVYNEEKSIGTVIEEWNSVLQSIVPNQFILLIIDDGSNDSTPEILSRLSGELDNLVLHRKANSGHGESCLIGYRRALQQNAEWILQIDSDYQCNPIYFKKFWNSIGTSKVIMGKRVKRLDGDYRWVLTKIISLWLFFATGKFCPDPNVPYRLIHADFLSLVLAKTPSISLANSFLSYKMMEVESIHWIDIHFRKRLFGVSFHKLLPSLRAILELTKALVANKSPKDKSTL